MKVQTTRDRYCLIRGVRVPNELKAMRMAQSAGIREFLPKILYQHPACSVLLLEWVEGKTLATSGFGLEEVSTIIQIIARLHNVQIAASCDIGKLDDHLITLMPRIVTPKLLVSELEKIVTRSLAYFESLQGCASLVPECAELIVNAMVTLRERQWPSNKTYAMVHGDVKPDNVILTDRGSVCLIDWENANITDPLMEVSYLIQRFAEHNISIMQNRYLFLHQYSLLSHTPGNRLDTLRFNQYCLIHATEFFAKSLGGMYRGNNAINLPHVEKTRAILQLLLNSSATASSEHL